MNTCIYILMDVLPAADRCLLAYGMGLYGGHDESRGDSLLYAGEAGLRRHHVWPL